MVEATTLERRGLARGLKVFLDILLILALLGSLVVLVIWPLACLAGNEVYDITVPVGIHERAFFPPDGVDGVTVDEPRGELRFTPDGFAPSAAFWLLTVVFSGALIYGLQLLRRILTTTADGFPFHRDNPRRLNHLGWIAFATALLATVSKFFFGRWALAQPQYAELPLFPTFEVHGEGIICGLFILVLASIWKLAVQMAEDQSLTI